MNFTKMEGLGNDYVYVDCTGEFDMTPQKASKVAKFVSDRHFGIGADGLILIKKSTVADFQMQMFNADGSQGEMCGNGIRCVGKFVYDKGLTKETKVSVETLAGIRYLEFFIKDSKVDTVKVNMGEPILKSSLVPIKYDGEDFINKTAVISDLGEKTFTCVSMGNPHAITVIDDVDGLDILKVGPKWENSEFFPNRVNTEFIEVIDRKNVKMRVWERGSGETFACGTGACAVLVACYLNGYTENEACIHLLGGDLLIELERETNIVYMTGKATTVFEGTIDIENI